ncbi:putative transport protein [Povalibacter uvarum]|uniref:Putative transport protein n=1 Tax=Povalibacter uvarum TaxID=732238 RepID=A0A841HR08_9GAMM|nr:TrkA C-terminal domain-containing protein [Povalibacter uvarum]MBB6095193.1 putative transport protein [Povalibacter uvarum]
MAESVLAFLRDQPVIALFLTIGFGCLLARVRVVGVELGAVAGTLLVSLFLGSQGFRISPAAQAVGFALFIFSVGYQAGPRFIEALKANGWRYLALSVVVCAIGLITALIAGSLLAMPPGGTAGLLSGSLTTTPMLAAAQEAVRSGIATLPAGSDSDRVIATIGTTYAITYIVGMLGIIVAVRLMPRIAGVDLPTAAAAMDGGSRTQPVQIQARGYRVTNDELCRQSATELARRFWDGFSIAHLRRSQQWLPITPEERLQHGDEIYVVGDATLFQRGISQLGEEISVASDVELSADARQVIVTQGSAVSRPLGNLNLARGHGILVTGLRRDALSLPLSPEVVLQRGDVLTVVGSNRALAALPALVGPLEAEAMETDMTTFAFGIAFGTAIGLLAITVAGTPIGLGTAGGLLASGVLVGWLNNLRPSTGKFPEAARWILMEFGLLIFICGVGLQSGSQVVETLREAGPWLVVAALAVVSIPVLCGYLFGRHVLKLPPVLLMGALTGAMTSGPALSLLIAEAKSSAPALGYTGTYAFSSIIMTIIGTLVMAF